MTDTPNLEQRIGMLRQWLNEERIKDASRFVTNDDIRRWLDMPTQATPNPKQRLDERLNMFWCKKCGGQLMERAFVLTPQVHLAEGAIPLAESGETVYVQKYACENGHEYARKSDTAIKARKQVLQTIQADLLAIIGDDEIVVNVVQQYANNLRAELRQAIREYTNTTASQSGEEKS